ncbi:MAG: sigma-70 family RNA polymerase sigma factor [Phaeodactylibacter sp.]|uniref:RNA polymerase sigma factor n=1 Tax=Phaeodactylibacter sp. TaxID=1940289 RepID=UPI0032EB224D
MANNQSDRQGSGSPINAADKSSILFEQLRRADVAAIQELAAKVLPEVQHKVKKFGLAKEDVQEILNDSILITLKAIRQGRFELQDYHPAAYTKSVARNLIANRVRSKKTALELQETMGGQSDTDPESDIISKERRAIVRELLSRLGENCRRVLLLKYFERLKDKDIVTGNLTPYSTVNSLKSKRGQCLKKLAEMAQKAGITKAF